MPISGSNMTISSPSGSTPGLRAEAPMTRRWVSFALIAPLLAFLIVSFIVPVLLMLARAVTDRDLDRTWPASAAALRTWDGEGLPSDALARTVAREMLAAHRAGTPNRVDHRTNYDLFGSRSLHSTTDRKIALQEKSGSGR